MSDKLLGVLTLLIGFPSMVGFLMAWINRCSR